MKRLTRYEGRGCPKCKYNKWVQNLKTPEGKLRKRIAIEKMKVTSSKSIKVLRFINKRKLPFEKVRNEFIKRGATPLFKEYKNHMSYLDYICSQPNCNNMHKITYNNLMRGYNEELHCSECIMKFNIKRGENHPCWKESLTEEDRQNRLLTPGFAIWRRNVLNRFERKCIVSGKEDIIVHHLYNWRDYPQYRVDINNGVCLTKDLHIEFHRKYGYGENSIQQFREFYKDKTGEELGQKLGDPVLEPSGTSMVVTGSPTCKDG